MGYIVLVILSAIQLFAACGLASRAYASAKAEGTLAACSIALYLVLAPIYALGYTGHLTVFTLGASSSALAALAWICSAYKKNLRAHAEMTLAFFNDVATSPYRAVRIMARESGFAAFAVVLLLAVVAFTFVLSWRIPSSSWDGVWYHDAIVFHAIRNHGFAPIPYVVEATNGFARGGELITLWMVIFGDSRVADGTNCFTLLLLACATYSLIRRYDTSRSVACVGAVTLALLPGCYLQLRSSYVDVTAAAFSVAVAHFATKPRITAADALLTAVCAGLALATKGNTLVWAPPLCLLVVVRCFFARPRISLPRMGALIASGVVLTCALAACTYWRNWITKHNPLYPVPVNFAPLNIHWYGTTGNEVTDINIPFWDVFERLFNRFQLGDSTPDVRVRGYGIAFPWIVIPLSAVGVMVGLVHLLLGKRGGSSVVVGVLMTAVVAISPAIWWTRYNIHHAAGMVLLATIAIEAVRSDKTKNAILGAMVALTMLTLVWHDGYWGVVDLKAALKQGETYQGTLMRLSAPILREREKLGRNDSVVVTEDYWFASLFFNRAISNRVISLPDGPLLQRALSSPEVRMAVVRTGSGTTAILEKNGFQPIGPVDAGNAWSAWRRKP